MVKKILPVRGTRDLLPEEYVIHEYIINSAKRLATYYGYLSIDIPIVEYVETFNKTLGDNSDILTKEMYTFLDKSQNMIALRPEFTAGIMRSIISNNLIHKLPIKFFSSGPVFRYDRPQAGRYRQFYQINFEHIGVQESYFDAEMIKLSYDLLKSLGVSDDILNLEINSLGCIVSRDNYKKALILYFNKYKSDLSIDSKKHLDNNPLRILDSKDSKDQKIIEGIPIIEDYYTDYSKMYFEKIKMYLDLLNVKYFINHKIVRGLDYYSHTVFELSTYILNKKMSLLGGGRYNDLGQIIGRYQIPSVGFAAGIDRLYILLHNLCKVKITSSVFVIPVSHDIFQEAVILADILRNNHISVNLLTVNKLKYNISQAVKKNARYIIIVGNNEVLHKKFKLKDLSTTVEQEFLIDDMIVFLKHNLVSV